MKIDIVGWESEGLRCPDMTINLLVGDEPAQVSLIQMPNGTGKTTSLKMLTATLTGTASRWRPEEIRALRRSDDTRDSGRFRVDLRADGKPITFELTLDFEEGRCQYRTTAPVTGGAVPRWEPPPSVRRFLTEEFIQLFVFDGEYAERLLNSNSNEAERAIDALCQLYLVDEISELAVKDWEEQVKGAGATTSTGLNLWNNKLKDVNKRIAKIKAAQKDAHKRLDHACIEINRLDAAINAHISGKTGLREEHEIAIREEADARASLDVKLNETMQQIRFPNALNAAFSATLISLKHHLDRLKLPEATSRQFFVELSQEEMCVCGRPLDQHSRNEIIVRSKLYLGQEEAGSINALKKDIETHCEGKVDEAVQKLQNTRTDMLRAMQALSLANQKASNLKQSLIDSGDAELKSMQTELEQNKNTRDELQELIDAIEGESSENDDPSTTDCLKTLLAARKEAEAKVAKISGTLRLKEQTDVVRQIAERSKIFARDEIRVSLRDECNRILLKVLGNDPLQIENIGLSLSLRNVAGQNQGGASMGQTLAVGYTFLMSLLSRGNNHFPLVVDSPCGSLGTGRRDAIGGLIPQLCTQFISFIIDTERDDFVPALERECEKSKGSIKYFTAFRNTAQTEQRHRSLPKVGVTRTPSATVVEGRDYFISFKE